MTQDKQERDRAITLVTEFDPEFDAMSGQQLQAALTLLSGPSPGTIIHLQQSEYTLGRDTGADITIDDPGLSRRHACVTRNGAQYHLQDLASTNGTYINGARLQGMRKLEDGDRIQLGRFTVLRYSLLDQLEQQANEKLYEMSVRDPLTGLFNRRHLDDRLRAEFGYAIRHRSPLCVIVMDVDRFKRVNDTYGHAAGDDVLRAVARGLQHIVRVEDFVARYGGEEFVILARGIDANGGLAFAERVRVYLGGLSIPVEGGATLSVTASFGVAHTETASYSSANSMVAAADSALYQAKSEGRNRVILAEPVRAERTSRRAGARQVTADLSRPIVPEDESKR